MRLHTTHALLGGLAAVAAIATLDASAQSSGSPSSRPPSSSSQPSRAPSSSSQSSATQSADDSKFLQEAIRGNMAEVKMGQLALQRAQSKDVRDYGQMLVDDHSKANKNATAAAQKMNVTPPTEPSAKQKATYDAMAKLSGNQFDSMFISHMVQDHEEDVAKYTAQAQSGDSSKATDYAKDTLPTLKTHLSKAQSIESKMSGSSSSNERSSSSPTTRPFGSPGSGEPSSSGSNQGRSGADDGTPAPRRAPQ
jgi:putative membrane protein